MMKVFLRKQAVGLGSLLLIASFLTNAAEASNDWYYHEKLTTPADSRALLKSYSYPHMRQPNLAKQPALKQWSWLKNRSTNQQAYLAPKSQQGRALPFWPDLKPKAY
jgi:hypothetical protein